MGTVDCNNQVGFKDLPEHGFIFEKLINILPELYYVNYVDYKTRIIITMKN